MTNDLIERLSSAAEGSRELDRLVWEAVGGKIVKGFASGVERWIDADGVQWETQHNSWLTHFTTMIDAALPGESIVEVKYNYGSCLWEATNYGGWLGFGNTEPLARRAAALKARKEE